MAERIICGHAVLVDDEDEHLLDAFDWRIGVQRGGRKFVRAGSTLLLHRLITRAPSGYVVDHANRNGLDNRRVNLRVCCHAQNSWNSKGCNNRSTGVKGIYREKGKRGFTVEIVAYGMRYRRRGIGTLEEARKIRDEIGKDLHGDFYRAA